MVNAGMFNRGGQELFKAQMIAGYFIPLTGLKEGPNGFSYEANTRCMDRRAGITEFWKNIFTEGHGDIHELRGFCPEGLDISAHRPHVHCHQRREQGHHHRERHWHRCPSDDLGRDEFGVPWRLHHHYQVRLLLPRHPRVVRPHWRQGHRASKACRSSTNIEQLRGLDFPRCCSPPSTTSKCEQRTPFSKPSCMWRGACGMHPCPLAPLTRTPSRTSASRRQLS
mmetsp:Transcript_155627/g.499076  ORF Transcript_155627/g.499076 Transcript_155627/m.499076 type:complete len:224 (+) Transcript_155627:516-1187(+)